LLDTQLLIWIAADTLPPKAVEYINDNSNKLFFSSASIWEIAIKSSQNRKDFVIDPSILYENLLIDGYIELPVTGSHALLIRSLPKLHNDPFDRILLAQSTYERITLLTSDEVLSKYPGSIIYIR
jgi:PIN domain nuclease of toxin-antitoxin system